MKGANERGERQKKKRKQKGEGKGVISQRYNSHAAQALSKFQGQLV